MPEYHSLHMAEEEHVSGSVIAGTGHQQCDFWGKLPISLLSQHRPQILTSFCSLTTAEQGVKECV